MRPIWDCPSGSLLPTYGYSIPTLLHVSTRGDIKNVNYAKLSVVQVKAALLSDCRCFTDKITADKVNEKRLPYSNLKSFSGKAV
ncbi:uncharacterized protein V6R79_013304 [Siganus canaliculatus]